MYCVETCGRLEGSSYAPVDVVIDNRVARDGFLALWWIVSSSPFVDDVLEIRRPQSDVLGTNILWKLIDGATFHAAVLSSTIHSHYTVSQKKMLIFFI